VAVRRWTAGEGEVHEAQELVELQRTLSPNKDDLMRIRQVWSADRYAEAAALSKAMYRVLFWVAVGLGLALLGVAYRCYSVLSTRWDTVDDRHHESSALGSLKTAREASRED
jgi:hypothetical protein